MSTIEDYERRLVAAQVEHEVAAHNLAVIVEALLARDGLADRVDFEKLRERTARFRSAEIALRAAKCALSQEATRSIDELLRRVRP